MRRKDLDGTCPVCGERPVEHSGERTGGGPMCGRCYDAAWRRRAGYAPRGSDEDSAIRRELWIDQHGQPHWTPERIILAMHRWARRHDGRPPGYRDWVLSPRRNKSSWGRRSWPSAEMVRKVFGTWNAAIEAAGFAPRPPGGLPWTRDTVIEALQRWAAEHEGDPPKCDERADGLPNHAAVRRIFGSWNNGIAAAGLTPRVAHRPRRTR